MLPVSWSEFLVIIGVSICLIGKKEIPEVMKFISNIIKHFKAFKMQAMEYYTSAMQELEAEQLKQELTSTIIGDDGKEYECYLPEALSKDIKFINEIFDQEKKQFADLKPEILDMNSINPHK